MAWGASFIIRAGRTSTVLLAGFLLCGARPASAGERLSFEKRLGAQRAIEEIYWRHRSWPSDNPGPKPPLSRVISETMLREKVEDYLRKSNELERTWHHTLTATELQAEMNRMAGNTHSPEVLRELFAALGNDPFLIAETLVRQMLAERLIRNGYARDERFHAELRRKAEAALVDHPGIAGMRFAGGDYRETTWLSSSPGATNPSLDSTEREIALDEATFNEWKATLRKQLAGSAAVGPLVESNEGFTATAVLEERPGRLRIASVSWPKRTFDDWWMNEKRSMTTALRPIDGQPILPAITETPGCTPDTWHLIQGANPDPRSRHTAVWTGTEMIVWGGSVEAPGLNSGGRYNPATDTWLPTSQGLEVPAPRSLHTAVWTGTEMIVWGGSTSSGKTNTGGRYDPVTDHWTPTSTAGNVALGRQEHTAVWTGTEMIVWGGFLTSGWSATGARYRPDTDSWSPTSMGANLPHGRFRHTAVWTGSEMIIWGGFWGAFQEQTGGRYDPGSDSWTPTNLSGAPLAREMHTAVWTGTEMIVWGGYVGQSNYTNTGGRYRPATDSWTPTTNTIAARADHTAVWTGSVMVVWGGFNPSSGTTVSRFGGRYNPVTNSWAVTSTTGTPSARYFHTAVWTGTQMIVWGGITDASLLTPTNTGARYDPVANTWTPTSLSADVPESRIRHSAVWTGTEMIVWGGAFASELNTGGRYFPATDSWLPTSLGAGVPQGRYSFPPLWTGTEMIVWGGTPATDAGGRYNPASDTWISISTTGAPAHRFLHTAVWTGSTMIVWGGLHLGGVLDPTGGRYEPATDSWLPTSMVEAPTARYFHTGVWTGSQMVVWGGLDGIGGDAQALYTGGRYEPTTDSWLPTSTVGDVPERREEHAAVWTGNEMLVWGGNNPGAIPSLLATGAAYDPVADVWTHTPTQDAPSAREHHTAVWTGDAAIFWGGSDGQTLLSGGYYLPSVGLWLATSDKPPVPTPREWHTAVWTGTQMIVWGGSDTSSGGLYCPHLCATWYGDQDEDGWGDSARSVTTCDAGRPPGYVGVGGDCADNDPSIHPGATETCNGLDDDCNQIADDVAAPSGSPLLLLARVPGGAELDWSATAGATRYDVVEGSLLTLRATGGNFSAATTGCVGDDVAVTSVTEMGSPPLGEGVWHVVRPENCGGSGSYDDGSSRQSGSRDPEIAASSVACP